MNRQRQPNTVLVVEDDNDARHMLESRLTKSGFRVVSACSGAEALDLAQHHLPDAITLDIGLADIDGTEVARRLYGAEATRDIPVIFVTGNINSRFAESGQMTPGHYVLRKPYDPQLLLLALARAMERTAENARPYHLNLHPPHIARLPSEPAGRDADRRNRGELSTAEHSTASAPPNQQELVEDFTHDARSVLFIIKEVAYALAAEADLHNSQEQRGLARLIRDRASELVDMTDVLVAGTSLSDGGLSPQLTTVGVRRLLREVIPEAHRYVRRRSGRLSCKLQRKIPDVRCDPELMRIALKSLLTSIVHYVGHGRLLSVRTRTRRMQTGAAVGLDLTVYQHADHGTGANARLHPSIAAQLTSSAKFRLAESLCRLCGAELSVVGRRTSLAATVLIPTAE